MPLVLRAAERDHRSAADVVAIRVRVSVVEDDSHAMRVVLILVDHEQRPLAIRPLQRIGRDEHVSRRIDDVGRGREEAMASAAGLHPLPRQQLACEELRGRAGGLYSSRPW